MKSPDDLLYVGTHGHVTAISKQRGRKVWSTSLPNTGYDIVTLLVENNAVYAISKGLPIRPRRIDRTHHVKERSERPQARLLHAGHDPSSHRPLDHDQSSAHDADRRR